MRCRTHRRGSRHAARRRRRPLQAAIPRRSRRSFLRPKALLEAREARRTGAIATPALPHVEDAAIRDIVRFQEDLGLSGINRRRVRRTYFHIDF